MTRAALYTRVSTEKQEDEGTSLATQLARCREYAEAHGYHVIGSYQDVHTGSLYRERPGLSALRELVRAGLVDVVIAYAIDRLSRQQAHVYLLVEEMTDAGARLELVTEDFEDSAVGRFIRSAKAFAAEVEHEKIAERTLRGKRARIEAGRILPGRVPTYGYRWRDDTKSAYDPDPDTAPIVKRMFADYLDGGSIRSVATKLMADGVPPPWGGKRWVVHTVGDILRRPHYAGQGYGWAWKDQGTRFAPEEGIALPAGTVPALVEPDVWQAVQERLSRNKVQSSRNARNPEAALLRGGFARCGYCHRTMTAISRGGGKRTGHDYFCQGKRDGTAGCQQPQMSATMVDAAVWARVRATLLNPNGIAAHLEQLRADDPTAEDLAAVDETLAAVAAQQANLTRHLTKLSDDYATAPLLAELGRLGQQQRALEAERARLLERRQSWQAQQSGWEEFGRWCRRVAANIDGLTYQGRREVLNDLQVRAFVFRPDRTPRVVIEAVIPLDELPDDRGPPSVVSQSSVPREHKRHITLRWTDADVAAGG